jgi:hypothetical protein
MNTGRIFRTAALTVSLILAGESSHLQAQENRHVVSLEELGKDSARPAQNRVANETAVRELFSSEQARKTLKSANIDYQEVDKAIGQLSDEDLAKVAERSRQVQGDFAAGSISGQGWIIILVAIAVLIIVLVVVF